MPAAAISIRHARVRSARPGDRARLVAAFEAATPASTGVPERAVLLIRQLRAERPLSAHSEVLGRDLIDLIRSRKVSARPAAQSGGDGDAYFADADSVEIAAVAQWLAQGRVDPLLASLEPTLTTPLTRWRRSLLNDAQRLPGLALRLVEQGLAQPWLTRFEDSELTQACSQLLTKHGAATALAEPFALPGQPPSPAAPRPQPGFPATIQSALSHASQLSARPAVRLLIAVAATAAQRPDLLATRSMRSWLQWLAAPERAQADPSAPDAMASGQTNAVPPPVPARPTARTRSRCTASLIEPHPVTLPGEQPSSDRRAPASSASQPRAPLSRPAPPDPPRAINPSAPFIASEAAPPLRPVVPVSSQHAGLLFLINIVLALRLYGDFTRPGDGLRGLSPFELLLMLGRLWFGRVIEHDPVAPMLRRLAALGPRERLGKCFEAPPWQVDSDWLAPWPCNVSVLRRGQPWHPAGFPLAELAKPSGNPALQRRRWLAGLARYLEARIARALGTTDRRGALTKVVQQAGGLRVEGEELVAAFSLDRHPIELRLAGIDRDPGWVPSAGRSIRFEFT